ncbi:MAG: hypothetical protein IPO80_08010 [Propionibacteriaceae bacterium]|nr:hypothetical protein [Propionibacteriaceae bacterium]
MRWRDSLAPARLERVALVAPTPLREVLIVVVALAAVELVPAQSFGRRAR